MRNMVPKGALVVDYGILFKELDFLKYYVL